MSSAWGPQVDYDQSPNGGTLSTTVTTIVAQATARGLGEVVEKVALFAMVELAAGTDTSGVLLNLRRGSAVDSPIVMSALFGNVTPAGKEGVYSVQWVDDEVPAQTPEQVYTLTATQVAASADGTLGDVSLITLAF